jgi:hypothetical protein
MQRMGSVANTAVRRSIEFTCQLSSVVSAAGFRNMRASWISLPGAVVNREERSAHILEAHSAYHLSQLQS